MATNSHISRFPCNHSNAEFDEHALGMTASEIVRAEAVQFEKVVAIAFEIDLFVEVVVV